MKIILSRAKFREHGTVTRSKSLFFLFFFFFCFLLFRRRNAHRLQPDLVKFDFRAVEFFIRPLSPLEARISDSVLITFIKKKNKKDGEFSVHCCVMKCTKKKKNSFNGRDFTVDYTFFWFSCLQLPAEIIYTVGLLSNNACSIDN